MNTRALTAEFVGTFALIFIGAGAGAIGAGGLVGVALAHGLVLIAVAAAFGPISGAHINPAVTLALWLGRQIKMADALAYIVVQLVGGIAGAFVLRVVLGGVGSGLGATVLAGDVSPAGGLLIEAILTFFLVNTIYNTAVSGKAGNQAPVAIGLTLAFCILMGGPLTGASLNPARTLGPAVVTGNYADVWVYLAGPVIGGLAAATLYDRLLKSR
jgi:aquaporin Z